MDPFIDSLQFTRSQSSVAFYLFLGVAVLALVGGSAAAYLFYKGVSLQQINPVFPEINLNIVLYVLAATIVVIVILTLLGNNFEVSITSKDSGINRAAPPFSVFWKPATGDNSTNPTNLVVSSENFAMSRPDVYTMSAEISLFDTRVMDTKGPYRHLVHRGSDDLNAFVPGSPGSVPKGQGGLNDGLPTQMNPGIFVDKFTNDIVIFIDTDPVKGNTAAYRESIRITDIPLKKPFYLHVTVHDQILEVFINCHLAATLMLKGVPRGVPNYWYGRVGVARATAIVQNLKLWNTDLYAFEIGKTCPVLKMPSSLSPSSCST
jgi:hypothetical protein